MSAVPACASPAAVALVRPLELNSKKKGNKKDDKGTRRKNKRDDDGAVGDEFYFEVDTAKRS